MCIIILRSGTGTKMSKDETIMNSNVNQLIINKLRSYPEDVAELAIEAIRQSESLLSEASVYEVMQNKIREVAKRQGGDS